MKAFQPWFEGTLTLKSVPSDWSDRIEGRIVEGFLHPGRRARSNYRVTRAEGDLLIFEAADFATAFAIGLNHVELRRLTGETLSYRVSFTRWNRYVVTQGVVLGTVLAIASFAPALERQIAALGSWLFWSLVGFWSLAWPWILTAIHRRFAQRLLEDILLEELEYSEPPRAQEVV